MADEAGVVETTAGATDLANRRLVTPLNQTQVLEWSGGNPIYIGRARPGTPVTFPGGLPASSAAAWAICKLTYDGSGNVVAIQWANGTIAYGAVWDNRASLNYS